VDPLTPLSPAAQVNETKEKMDASVWAMIQLYKVE